MKLKIEIEVVKKILKLSMVLMFVLLLKSSLVGLMLGGASLFVALPMFKITWLFIAISYYLQSFVLLFIFSLIRERSTLSIFKIGAAYGLLIWFVTNGIFLLINLMSYLSPDVRESMDYPYFSTGAQITEIILKIIVSSLASMAMSVVISWIYSKYISKNKSEKN